MTDSLAKEFKFYLDNQNDLVKKYNGQFIVIKDCKVIGVYSSEIEAVQATAKEHAMGTFLVQKCEPGSAGYTQTYHSRAIFV